MGKAIRNQCGASTGHGTAPATLLVSLLHGPMHPLPQQGPPPSSATSGGVAPTTSLIPRNAVFQVQLISSKPYIHVLALLLSSAEVLGVAVSLRNMATHTQTLPQKRKLCGVLVQRGQACCRTGVNPQGHAGKPVSTPDTSTGALVSSDMPRQTNGCGRNLRKTYLVERNPPRAPGTSALRDTFLWHMFFGDV